MRGALEARLNRDVIGSNQMLKAWFQSLAAPRRLGKMDVGSLGGAFEVRLKRV